MIGPADPFAPARRINGRFVNASGYAQNGVLPVLKWFATRQPGAWPKHIANGAPAAPLARGHDEGIRVTLIGHATVLIQVAGLNILTDRSGRNGPGLFRVSASSAPARPRYRSTNCRRSMSCC